MKRTIIVVSLLLAVGLSIGCNRAKDEVLPDGTKLFGERTLKDGTRTAERKEFPNGRKDFNQTWLTNGGGKADRIELPDGEKQFDVTWLPDGTEKIGRVEHPNGEKYFDITHLPDGTEIVGRATKADGTEIPTFSTVQNDQQGYADVKWDTAISDLDPSATGESASCFLSSGDREENEAIAAAFGAQTQDTVVAGTVIETSLDFSAVPAKCKSVAKGDVRLITYDDKLAMAFTHLDAHNYESIASEMTSKFTEMDGWSVKWGGGAESDGDSTSINVRLFKRGNTNTRVFLLKRTDHEGCCGINVSSVFLLYVPNADYLRIQEDMAKVKRDKEAQQVAERQKREQPDLQKIQ